MMPARHRPAIERIRSVGRALLLLLGFVGCSSAVEPPSSVTLQVTNATCEPGPCQAIRVLAFPKNQPLTPGGLWSLDLGAVTGATACIALPPTASFTVTNASTGEATVTTWTTGESLSLAPWPASDGRFTATPTTAAFVPASASSWSVVLPGSAAPVAAQACTN